MVVGLRTRSRVATPSRVVTGGRVTLLWLLTFTFVLTGCSYAVKITATRVTDSEDRIREDEIVSATAAVSRIAEEFNLTACADPMHHKQVSADLGLRELACFSHSADRTTDWSKVLLLAFIDETKDHQLVVLLRDWSSLRSTTFTDSLREHLVAALSKALPSATIRFDRVYDTPILYVP